MAAVCGSSPIRPDVKLSSGANFDLSLASEARSGGEPLPAVTGSGNEADMAAMQKYYGVWEERAQSMRGVYLAVSQHPASTGSPLYVHPPETVQPTPPLSSSKPPTLSSPPTPEMHPFGRPGTGYYMASEFGCGPYGPYEAMTPDIGSGAPSIYGYRRMPPADGDKMAAMCRHPGSVGGIGSAANLHQWLRDQHQNSLSMMSHQPHGLWLQTIL